MSISSTHIGCKAVYVAITGRVPDLCGESHSSLQRRVRPCEKPVVKRDPSPSVWTRFKRKFADMHMHLDTCACTSSPYAPIVVIVA